MSEKIKLVAVAGPTGSGKSRLAVALAQALHGQVISCDSMQIYKGMDVGTGKVTEKEKKGIRHRMLDIASPDESFSLAGFAERAHREIAGCAREGFLPILCGGTGLYLENLLYDTALSEAPKDDAVRTRLEREPSESLYARLCAVDPESAAATHPNNRKRVIRALEIYELTGKTKTAWDNASKTGESRYDAAILLLIPEDRAQLYGAIDRRVDGMFSNGLEDEVRRVFSQNPSETALQAIGYKEFLPCFEGQCTLDEVKDKIKQASRNYAKRQLTWFLNRMPDCPRVSSALEPEEQTKAALRILQEKGFAD